MHLPYMANTLLYCSDVLVSEAAFRQLVVPWAELRTRAAALVAPADSLSSHSLSAGALQPPPSPRGLKALLHKASLPLVRHSVGDAESSLADATSSLADVTSSLGDAKSSLGLF